MFLKFLAFIEYFFLSLAFCLPKNVTGLCFKQSAVWLLNVAGGGSDPCVTMFSKVLYFAMSLLICNFAFQ
jgi:hypothetical protein